MPYTAFRRQFLVARSRFVPRGAAADAGGDAGRDDWRYRPLGDGWTLSWQADLDLAALPAAGGGTRLRLGPAWGGSGRFALLEGPYLGHDGAAALMPLFYARQEDGALVVGSTPSLVALALGRDPAAVDLAEPLRHHSGMNYLPAPGTRYLGIHRLLRDQRLNLATGGVERHPAPIAPLASYAAAVETLTGELGHFARELRAATPGAIFAQLTAGLDSRTVVAAFVAEGIAFETVTLRSRAKPEADITVARRLSRRLGVRHYVIDLETPPDPTAREVYRLQTAGATNGWDMTDLFPGNAYRFLGAGDVMVGGLCFGIGREKLDALDGLTLESATGAEIWRRLGREAGPPVFCGFLDQWLDWRRSDPYPLDLAASYYLDQRIPAWIGTLLCGFDLLPGRTVHPANNPLIYAALLTPELRERREGRLQHDVIRALAPGLAGEAINPVSLGRRLQGLAALPRRALRAAFGGKPEPAPATPASPPAGPRPVLPPGRRT